MYKRGVIINKIRIIPIIETILDFLNCSYQIDYEDEDTLETYAFTLIDSDISRGDYTKFYVIEHKGQPDLFSINISYYVVVDYEMNVDRMIGMLIRMFNPYLESDDLFLDYYHAREGIEKIIDEIYSYTPEELELFLKML